MDDVETKKKKFGRLAELLLNIMATIAVHVEERKKQKQQELKPVESAS